MLAWVASAAAAVPIRLDPVERASGAGLPASVEPDSLTEWVGESLEAAEHSSAQAQRALHAMVTSVSCGRERGGTTCEVGVRWQLRDLASGTETYAVLTRGLGRAGPSEEAEAVEEAVADATRRLLARPRFTETLASTTGMRPPPITVRTCADPPPSLPSGLELALATAVFVEVPDGTGSGVAISPDGWILTAAHVVNGQDDVKVHVRNGTSVRARVVALDNRQDVALLRAEGDHWACLSFTPAPAEVGTELYAIGSPFGEALDFSVSKGIVSGARRSGDIRFLQTDASLNPGNSGGPLVDLEGHLLAIVSWKVAGEGVEGLGFGVPVDAVEATFSLRFGEGSVEPDEPWIVAPVQRISDTDDPARRSVAHSSRHVGTNIGGAIVGSVGAMFILGTWASYAMTPEMTQGDWTQLRVVNTVGWVGLASGAGIVAVPMLTANDAGALLTGRF